MPNVVKKVEARIARPLKVLVPLIQEDLRLGDEAGGDYYRAAGEKLIEAQPQVTSGAWGGWLRKNFDIGPDTARRHMQWALYCQKVDAEAETATSPPQAEFSNYSEFRGDAKRLRAKRKVEAPLRKMLRELDQELFGAEKQTEAKEIKLHRDLALELIDVGFKALATRLHPDRGGSVDAMARLNRIRGQLKTFAERRRFV